MKILKDRARSTEGWPKRIKCGRCKSDLEVNLSDLRYDKWKVGGYWFAGTEQIEGKYTFDCPACDQSMQINENIIPVGIKQDLVADYQRRKRKSPSTII